jgi:hypothetical protein
VEIESFQVATGTEGGTECGLKTGGRLGRDEACLELGFVFLFCALEVLLAFLLVLLALDELDEG